MICSVVRSPRGMLIAEIYFCADNGAVPRNHFLQTGRPKGDVVQSWSYDAHDVFLRIFDSLADNLTDLTDVLPNRPSIGRGDDEFIKVIQRSSSITCHVINAIRCSCHRPDHRAGTLN